MEHEHRNDGAETMANTELGRLLKMANDIANNLEFHADAADRIADHLNRFWAPRMRQALIDYADGNNEMLSDLLQKAVLKLRPQ